MGAFKICIIIIWHAVNAVGTRVYKFWILFRNRKSSVNYIKLMKIIGF